MWVVSGGGGGGGCPLMNGVFPNVCDGLEAFFQEACLEEKGRQYGDLSAFFHLAL